MDLGRKGGGVPLASNTWTFSNVHRTKGSASIDTNSKKMRSSKINLSKNAAIASDIANTTLNYLYHP